MKNRAVYLKDPATRTLVNQGVAFVNDDMSREAQMVLRYELETFVCDGQYEKGLADIIETCLKNINQADQPGVWVSGFYGSGKSHLVKMLRALWTDMSFEDGASARGITSLPPHIKDLLKELTTQGKRHGGLHAASGTLGAGASGSVRLALLRIIFKSVGLPQLYPVARFVMWLKENNLYEQIRAHVETNGHDWEFELSNFHVAEGLYNALCEIKPKVFSPNFAAVEIMPQLYPNVTDVSNDDMITAIRQALTREGKFPLTLIALDEVQQYIAEDPDRSAAVQQVVETCCKQIGGKLLFVGTGQTAVTGTPNLKKLEGRFTVRIELSDTDVDTVIRKVILAKNPDAITSITKIMETNIGEISRHLSTTTIGHRQDDVAWFSQDYPILPVRRRFWEHALRVLDQTGTESQLRNQLSMIHKVIQTNLDEPLGNVVPGDYLYMDAADKMLQARMLPRKVHEKTMQWAEGNPEDQLRARASGLVFLINKLGGSNKDIGIRATADTIADLMVKDLSKGSGELRSKLPTLLNACGLLMKVGDEYRIQTQESEAWNNEFLNQRSQLANAGHRIEAERDDRIRKIFSSIVKKCSLNQGESLVPRDIYPLFDAQLPADSDKKIYIWVRSGWDTDESNFRAEARQAGNSASTIYVYIPKRSSDELRRHIMDYKAAAAALEIRGVSDVPEWQEARAAMETTRQVAEGKIRELLGEAFSGAQVFQGGGADIKGDDLQSMILEAAQNALKRLYDQFQVADQKGWDKVYAKAKQGAPDALKGIGFDGEAAAHPVCKIIQGFIGGGKKGADIRQHFEAPPYGWSGDAIDGGLLALLVGGQIRAADDHGKAMDPRELERKAIGKLMFKIEATTITTPQRIQIRKVMQKIGCAAKPGEEHMMAPAFMEKIMELSRRAGGEPPKPAPPDIGPLEEIRLLSGNEQLLAIYNQREVIAQSIDDWSILAEKIDARNSSWNTLEALLAHARGLKDNAAFMAQADKIREQRLLIADPDPISPLLSNVVQALREALNDLNAQYEKAHEKGMNRLRNDANWQKLEPEQRNELLAEQHLTINAKPAIGVKTTDEILATLTKFPLSALADRVAAMSSRFSRVLEGAARLLEPEVQFLHVKPALLKNDADIDTWAEDVKKELKAALKKGPIGIR